MFRLSHWLVLLLIAVIFHSCDQPTPQKRIDFKDLVNKEVLAICDSLTANRQKLKENPSLAIRLVDSLMGQYPADKDSATHYRLMYQFAYQYSDLGQYDSAAKYMDMARPYFESHPEFPFYQITCYGVLGGNLLNAHVNTFKANYYLTRAASLCLIHSKDSFLSIEQRTQYLYKAAEANLESTQLEQALHFGKAAYESIYPYRDSFQRRYMLACVVLSNIYTDLRYFDSARIYIREAEKYSSQANPSILANIHDSKASYFYETKQYDSSLKYKMILEQFLGKGEFSLVYDKLQLAILLNNRKLAKQSLSDAEMLLPEISDEVDIANFNNYKTRYFIAYGSRDSALSYFQRYDSLIRTNYDNDRLKMFASIESEYNLTEKQKNIDQLATANKNARDEIRQKNNLLIISLLAIALLGAGVGVFFLVARQRKLASAKQSAESQRDKVMLEQRLLRTQMEPHFIFNTLNAMKSMIRNHETENAILYLDRFAYLLRTCLENSMEDFVLVSEEVEALQHYLSLQAIRFSKKFDYVFHLYDGYEEDDIRIPPMLLQPFVENALLHGLKEVNGKGLISIYIEKGDRQLECRVEDNGAGLSSSSDPKRKSRAIQIVRERLAIISKETGYPASVALANKTGIDTGTVVTILIPFL